jgi:hypothetical protein
VNTTEYVEVLGGKKHFYQPCSLNTGVILMNLAAMRSENLTFSRLMEINDEPVLLSDQDIINSYGYYYPERILKLECVWNKRRRSHCPNDGDEWLWDQSIGILHGNGAAFYAGRQNMDLRNIYNAYAHRYYFEFCKDATPWRHRYLTVDSHRFLRG